MRQAGQQDGRSPEGSGAGSSVPREGQFVKGGGAGEGVDSCTGAAEGDDGGFSGTAGFAVEVFEGAGFAGWAGVGLAGMGMAGGGVAGGTRGESCSWWNIRKGLRPRTSSTVATMA